MTNPDTLLLNLGHVRIGISQCAADLARLLRRGREAVQRDHPSLYNAFSPGGISDDAKIDKGAELFSRDSHVWACKAGFSSANLYRKQVSKGGELGRSLMAMSLRQVAD